MGLISPPRFQRRPRVSPSSLPRVAPILPEPPPPSPVSADVANVAPFVDAPLKAVDQTAPRGKFFAHVVEPVEPPSGYSANRQRRIVLADRAPWNCSRAAQAMRRLARRLSPARLSPWRYSSPSMPMTEARHSSPPRPSSPLAGHGRRRAGADHDAERPAAPTTAGELPHFAALEPADAIPLPPRRPTMIKLSRRIR